MVVRPPEEWYIEVRFLVGAPNIEDNTAIKPWVVAKRDCNILSKICGCGRMVLHFLAKEDYASSILATRSMC